MARAAVRSALRSVPKPSRGSGVGGAFNPIARLFAAGELGVMLDPSDMTTMWQDSAKTTPVTAAGQSVGYIADKSGRGNHFSQPTAGSRPTLQQDASGFWYLDSGAGGWMQSVATVNLSTVEAVTLVAGVRKTSDAAACIFLEHSATFANNGTFRLAAPVTSGIADFAWGSRGTGSSSFTGTGNVAPISAVVTGQGQISTDTCILRINGAQAGAAPTDQGTGNYQNASMFLFKRAGTSLQMASGRMYSLILRATVTAAADLAKTEKWVGARMGIAL